LIDLFPEGGFQLLRGEEVRLVQLAYTGGGRGERSVNGRRFDRLRVEKFESVRDSIGDDCRFDRP
jgi:hypothetical protein